EVGQEVAAFRQQLDAGQAERDQLRAQLQAGHERVSALERLEGELQAQRAEVARLQAELEVSQQLALYQAEPQVADAGARELLALRTQRDLWHEEIQSLRLQLKASGETADRLRRVTKELEGVRGERDRLKGERETEARGAEELRSRVSSLEQS